MECCGNAGESALKLLWRMLAGMLALSLAMPVAAKEVAVTGGMIKGSVTNDGSAHLFQGIPFAAPPLGQMRWKPPAPVIPWQGVRDATNEAPACLQNDYEWNRAQYRFGSEDCLTLDVRAPTHAAKKLPVMVWIHGGSNRAGGSGGTVQSSMTQHGVVLVSVQYRLGIFGFLSHRQLADEQGGHSGNYGLMDQIAALRWVRDNIAVFGGNPDNVTIFGESAGSQDVSLLLAAPAARGLFHKAIMQSGTPAFGMTERSLPQAFATGDQLDMLAGAMKGISDLRKMSAHALLAADLKLRDPAIWSADFLWLRPTIDGAVLTGDLATLLADAPKRPVIIGSNRFEFGPAKDSIDVAAYARHWLGSKSSEALPLYFAEEGKDPRLGHLEGRLETDVVFRCPANNLATKLASLDWPVWRYEFDVGPGHGTSAEGLTSHAYEISFIMDRKPIGPASKPIQLQDIWAHFATTGRPQPPSDARWPPYARQHPAYMLFDRNGMTQKTHLRAEHCAFVSAI